MPVVALRGKVAFPNTTVTFEVGREITLAAIERANLTTDKLMLVCTQKQTEQDDITPEDIYDVGCVVRIKQITKLSVGVIKVSCEGLYRAKAREIRAPEGYFVAVCDELKVLHNQNETLEEATFRTAKALVKDVLYVDGKIPKEVAARLESCEDSDLFVNVAFSAMRVKLHLKQKALEETDVLKRLQLLDRCLNDELEISKIERKIAASVRQNIDKSQKEYFLREQLKAIHTELGDDNKEEDEWEQKIKQKGLPEGLEEKCLKEIARMRKMQSAAPEYTVLSGYIEQVLSLPFTEQTTDTQSLSECIDILEQDHFGLEKVKERIIEYLAVLKTTGALKAPILCLVGPPGVGKTSIAQSIARALGRKFVRMSLGGVKDEAEIRGHRRTYIGAMPGRILYGMKQAGSINPVFLLDEIDKITADMHGDPASALLETLDPEQNATFRDRYLEYPYDLSKVLFITTANSLETIPGPLRDRMEIISLSGYTLEEKTEIARRYLIPKQLSANGLTQKDAVWEEGALAFLIEGYTREAGVRSLERTVSTVYRKVAVQKLKAKRKSAAKITKAQLQKWLGAPMYTIDEAALEAQVGAVCGLAWTAVGGTTLTVEVAVSKGKGDIKLTGKLGEVMKESAQAAIGYLKANAERFHLSVEDFENKDLHVHVPEGATPKDGPSAGITMATAILSAMTGKAVRGDLAMTGEITLRGNVLPIGGLKEKALAARRVGISTVIIPFGNKKDLEELPEVVKKDITFIPVKRADEVFARAFVKEKKENKPQSGEGESSVKPLSTIDEKGQKPTVRCNG